MEKIEEQKRVYKMQTMLEDYEKIKKWLQVQDEINQQLMDITELNNRVLDKLYKIINNGDKQGNNHPESRKRLR